MRSMGSVRSMRSIRSIRIMVYMIISLYMMIFNFLKLLINYFFNQFLCGSIFPMDLYLLL